MNSAFKSKSLLFFGLAFLLIYGCKDSPVEDQASRKQMISGKTWKYEKIYELVSGTARDVTSLYGNGYFILDSDGKFTSSVMIGTWSLSADESKINLATGSAVFTADILELTDKSMRLKINLSSANPPSILDITFSASNSSATTSPEINFETLWKEFDQRYSFFDVKKINWDSLYTVYRPQVTSTTSDQNLLQIMSSMLGNLKDGHVSLTTPVGSYSYKGWFDKYLTNYPGEAVTTKYLSKDFGKAAGGNIRFGIIENVIGYIYIGPLLTGDANTWYQDIDRIIDSLKNMKGIIVDIRSNGGGNDGLGNIVASRFTNTQRVYSYIRWRNGVKHSDFTDYSPATISPQGKQQYLQPVAFLTNRRCFSSAEGTTLMFRSLPNVTSIGDTTGGGSANPIALTLPNGWSYRVSRWIQYTADKKVFEGKGLAPDIPVQISAADAAAGKDLILEKAVQFLKNK
jgi:hypothetical protein